MKLTRRNAIKGFFGSLLAGCVLIFKSGENNKVIASNNKNDKLVNNFPRKSILNYGSNSEKGCMNNCIIDGRGLKKDEGLYITQKTDGSVILKAKGVVIMSKKRNQELMDMA